MALTKRLVDSFTYEGRNRSADYRHDTKYGSGGVKGFAVRDHPPGRRVGRKTFEVWYRMAPSSTPKWYIIGEYGTWTLDKARKEAQRILVGVSQGIDPKAPANIESVTLNEFSGIFLADMEARGKATVSEMRRRLNKRLLPRLGKKLLGEITLGDISRLHSQIGRSAKIEANRVVQLLKLVFSRAVKMGYLPDATPNPCRDVDLFAEHSRTRYLNEDELERLLEALRTEPEHIQCLILLYLTTGLRKSELLSLEWDFVYLDAPAGAYVDVSMTKAGRPLRLALSSQAVGLFKQIPTRVHGRYVFPSPVRVNQPLKDFKRYWSRIRDRAGIPDATIHDLRRTVGSRLAQAGVPVQHISEVLGHRDSAVTAIYARLSEDTQRAALEKAGADLEELLGPITVNPTGT